MDRKINWQAVAAIVAILGLVITLWVNIYAVERSTQTNDLQLLTQMHRAVIESSGQFYSKHGSEFINYLSGDDKADLSGDAWTDLRKMLADIEYSAFLFNRRYIKDEQARKMWIPSVKGAIVNGFEALKKNHQNPAKDYPECRRILESAVTQEQ